MARADWGIGIVGLGGIAGHHLESYRKEGLTVLGGADVDEARARAMGERFGLRFVTTDYRRLIDLPGVRIVDVTVPHDRLDRRLPIIEYAARNGKALLVQKPLMSYLDQARQLVAAAEAHGVPFMVNQNSIFAPRFRAAERLLRDPKVIGKPYYAQIENRSWVDPPKDRYVGKDPRWVNADMAIHHFALLRQWFGDVESVYAVLGKDVSQRYCAGDTLGVVSLRFKNGVQAAVINNWCYRGNLRRAHAQEEVIVQGDQGALTCDAQGGLHVKCVDGREFGPEFSGQWFPDAFGAAMVHFVEALDSGLPFLCSGRDNLKSVALIEASYISAAENRVVRPDDLLGEDASPPAR